MKLIGPSSSLSQNAVFLLRSRIPSCLLLMTLLLPLSNQTFPNILKVPGFPFGISPSRLIFSNIRSPNRSNWIQTAVSKAEQGNLAASFRSIGSNGLAFLNSPSTIESLKSLHPDVPSLASPAFPSSFDPIEMIIPQGLVEKLVRSFPLGTAPGPDGFRVQHLLDILRCVAPHSPHDVRPAINRLMLKLCSGDVPLVVSTSLSSAKLIPLLKKDASIRPIAIGNVWRRICSKLLISLSSDQISAFSTSNSQFGVGCPLGAEIMVHSTRMILQAKSQDPNFVILKIDFRNAFNCVSRSVFLNYVKSMFPLLYPFVSSMYCSTSPLYLDNSTSIPSINGTQQGDPLGPFLFSLVLDSLLQELPKAPLWMWYLDDGIIGGPPDLISKIASLIDLKGPDFGLHINFQKCSLLWTGSSDCVGDDLFPASIPRPSDGFTVLGVPLGPPRFVEAEFQLVISKSQLLINKLPLLNDPQISFALLSKCFGFCRVSYFLRCSPPSFTSSLSSSFDSLMVKTFESIIGKDLSEHAKLQLSLPIKDGGMGIRSCSKHAPAAFIASLNACESHISRVIGPSPTILSLEKKDALSYLSKSLGSNLLGNLPLSYSQKVISEAIDKASLASLLDQSSFASVSRIRSCSGPHGSLLLYAPLSPSRGCKLNSQEFSFFISSRLGLANLCNSGDKCNLCKKDLDPLGYHFSICKFGHDSVTHRHNALRDVLFFQCQRALWNPKLEIAVGTTQYSHLTPADIYIPTGPGSQPLALDVTVAHPLVDPVACSKAFDVANIRAERRKLSKYSDLCSKNQIKFQPLSIEFFGRLSENTLSFVSKLATAISNRGLGAVSTVLKDIQRKIIVTLTRSSARAALARVPSFQHLF